MWYLISLFPFVECLMSSFFININNATVTLKFFFHILAVHTVWSQRCILKTIHTYVRNHCLPIFIPPLTWVTAILAILIGWDSPDPNKSVHGIPLPWRLIFCISHMGHLNSAWAPSPQRIGGAYGPPV